MWFYIDKIFCMQALGRITRGRTVSVTSVTSVVIMHSQRLILTCILFMDLQMFSALQHQKCYCGDKTIALDWISMIAKEIGNINLVYDNIYVAKPLPTIVHMVPVFTEGEIFGLFRADIPWNDVVPSLDKYPARYLIENGFLNRVVDANTFIPFLHDHMRKVLQMSSLSDSEENLHFVVLCKNHTVDRILKQAEEADDTIGMRSLLRHFSKWLILLDEPHDFVMETVLDHISTATIAGLRCLGHLMPCTAKIGDVNSPQKCCETSPTPVQVSTLMWTPDGREWAPVHPLHVSSDQMLLQLFPNTLRGLNGRQLSLTLLEWLPMSKRIFENATLTYSGAGIDIVRALSSIFNFSYTFVEPADQQWGSKGDNSSWSGIIGMLQRQEADMCPVDYAINYERSKVMDISVPIMQLYRVAVYRKMTDTGQPWLLLISFFQWKVYVCGLAVFLWIVLLFSFVRYVLKRHGGTDINDEIDWVQLYLPAAFRQGMKKYPSSCSLRVLLGCWCISCLVVTAVYSGNLVAVATVETHTLPFSTLQDLASQEEYDVGAMAGEYAVGVFKMSKNDVFSRLWHKIQQSMKRTAKQYQDDVGYHKSLLLSGKYVLITTSMVLGNLETETCELSVMREKFLPSHSGFAFPRNSPLLKLFNPQLLSFVEEGLIDVVVQKWTAAKKECSKGSTRQSAEFKLSHLITVYIVCGAGIVLATITLLFERLLSELKPGVSGKLH